MIKLELDLQISKNDEYYTSKPLVKMAAGPRWIRGYFRDNKLNGIPIQSPSHEQLHKEARTQLIRSLSGPGTHARYLGVAQTEQIVFIGPDEEDVARTLGTELDDLARDLLQRISQGAHSAYQEKMTRWLTLSGEALSWPPLSAAETAGQIECVIEEQDECTQLYSHFIYDTYLNLRRSGHQAAKKEGLIDEAAELLARAQALGTLVPSSVMVVEGIVKTLRVQDEHRNIQLMEQLMRRTLNGYEQEAGGPARLQAELQRTRLKLVRQEAQKRAEQAHDPADGPGALRRARALCAAIEAQRIGVKARGQEGQVQIWLGPVPLTGAVSAAEHSARRSLIDSMHASNFDQLRNLAILCSGQERPEKYRGGRSTQLALILNPYLGELDLNYADLAHAAPELRGAARLRRALLPGHPERSVAPLSDPDYAQRYCSLRPLLGDQRAAALSQRYAGYGLITAALLRAGSETGSEPGNEKSNEPHWSEVLFRAGQLGWSTNSLQHDAQLAHDIWALHRVTRGAARAAQDASTRTLLRHSLLGEDYGLFTGLKAAGGNLRTLHDNLVLVSAELPIEGQTRREVRRTLKTHQRRAERRAEEVKSLNERLWRLDEPTEQHEARQLSAVPEASVPKGLWVRELLKPELAQVSKIMNNCARGYVHYVSGEHRMLLVGPKEAISELRADPLLHLAHIVSGHIQQISGNSNRHHVWTHDLARKLIESLAERRREEQHPQAQQPQAQQPQAQRAGA